MPALRARLVRGDPAALAVRCPHAPVPTPKDHTTGERPAPNLIRMLLARPIGGGGRNFMSRVGRNGRELTAPVALLRPLQPCATAEQRVERAVQQGR
jgi:hypothetical protein